MAKLSDIIISKVRVKLLKIFLSKPTEMYFVRELTRMAKEEINAIRRELEHLQSVGLLKSEKRGNRLYYSVRTNNLLYPELTNLVAKTSGIGKLVIRNRARLGFVKYAVISQRIARNLPSDPDCVDILLVGRIIMPQVALIIEAAEKKLGSAINYSCMTEEEFSYRKKHQDAFLMKILMQPRVMLVGDEISFVS